MNKSTNSDSRFVHKESRYERGIMWREVLILSLASGAAHGGFPYITPTQGQVWPIPREVKTTEKYFIMGPENFNFTIKAHTCDVLELALARYSAIIFSYPGGDKKKADHENWRNNDISADPLTGLDIVLTKECEKYPYLGMNEEYDIRVSSSNNVGTATLNSTSIWGILRGLETFSQILIPDPKPPTYVVNETIIKDGPRFPHRGLLIDTSRHYLPLLQILYTIDILAMNKMNVLHWHIVDSQSFPYVSEAFPELSGKGAYNQERLYAPEEIGQVIDYGRLNGVRVVPEFDTPGHTQSWGPGQPGFLTPCYSGDKPDGTFGPVDPTNEDNYDFLKEFFKEVAERFPDHYVHLGGDEVSFDCWKSNPQITDFMKKENITGDYGKLEEVYITKLLEIVSNLPTKNGYIIWQEVFDNGVKIAPDTVVQVWKGGWQDEMAKVTEGGFKTLLSSCWYLDYISYGADWRNYYSCDPFDFNGTSTQKELIQGGEACIWGEFVDKTNLIPRTWPRASAVAEKLWSPEELSKDANSAAPRIEEFRCKLVYRGYNVESLGPSFCMGDNI
ncbi:beta-hexosaminidase subunit beta-like isoform X2 [Palaemon carinicauda]|uniref:beta-hexosaminidase subunit beta-like isoform X2 n=1 Tax=Palaemon carinicauda TaxID=392227 RepID=UPI0035B5A282